MQNPKIRRTTYIQPVPDWVLTVRGSFPEDMRKEARRVNKGRKEEGGGTGRKVRKGARKKLGKVTLCNPAEPGLLKKVCLTHCSLLIYYRSKLNTHESLENQ